MHQIKLACLGAFLHKNWTGLILLICVFFHTFRKKNLLIQKGFLKKYLQVCKTSCWEISYEGGGGELTGFWTTGAGIRFPCTVCINSALRLNIVMLKLVN